MQILGEIPFRTLAVILFQIFVFLHSTAEDSPFLSCS